MVIKLTETAAAEVKRSMEDLDTDISKRGFTFNNPNAVKSCGCGSSFQA